MNIIRIKFFIALLIFISINISHVNCQTPLQADEFVRKAEEFRKNSNPDSAIIYYEKAAIEYKTAGSIEKLANAYNKIGVILTRQDKYPEAKSYLQKALSTALPALDSNSLAVAAIYISMGVVYDAEEQYSQSLDYHYKALNIRIKKSGEYDTDVATSYGNIGNVYLHNKEYDKSLEAHLKAMRIREKLFGASSAEVTQTYNHLGNVYKELKDYKTSITYFEKALQNKIALKSPEKDLGKIYKSLSTVYLLDNNVEKGNYYKLKSEEVHPN